jgi:hypothetical protein
MGGGATDCSIRGPMEERGDSRGSEFSLDRLILLADAVTT